MSKLDYKKNNGPCHSVLKSNEILLHNILYTETSDRHVLAEVLNLPCNAKAGMEINIFFVLKSVKKKKLKD